MAVSFGLAKKIIDHPTYNFGIALPFVCAFYVLNSKDIYVIPWLDISLGYGLSTLFNIFGVAFYYLIALFTFMLASTVSKAVESSKAWLALVAFYAVASIYAFFTQDNVPCIGVLFGALSVIYLLLVWFGKENGTLSLSLVVLAGGAFSLLSFVLGILWFDGHYLFPEIITNIFGITDINPESRKIGAAMLITSGYVIYYTVFQAGELWNKYLISD